MNQTPAIVLDNAAAGGRRQANTNDFIQGAFAGTQPVNVFAASAGADFDITTGGVATLIDGETPVAGNLYLLKDQTDPLENGVYIAAAGSWTMSPEYVTRVQTNQTGLIYVMAGTSNDDTYWQQTTVSPTVGTNALVYVNPWAVTAVSTEQLVSDKLASVTVASGDVVALDPTVNNAVVLNDATINSSTTYKPYGVVVTGATSGSNATIATAGEITLAGTPFLLANIGANVWASQSTAGVYTLTAPTTLNKYRSIVGTVSATNKIQLTDLGVVAELVQAAV